MTIKERHILNGRETATLSLDEKEFIEFRDTMQAIGNDAVEILECRPEFRDVTIFDLVSETGAYRPAHDGCIYTVRINDRVDESIEAYTAGAYLAGEMTEEDANRLSNWRENAESFRVEFDQSYMV